MLIASAAPAQAELIPGSGGVNGWRASAAYYYDAPPISGKAFAWEYAYWMDFDGTTVTADIQIEFDFDDEFTGDKQVWKEGLKTAIEEQWNNGHTFVLDTATITCFVDVTDRCGSHSGAQPGASIDLSGEIAEPTSHRKGRCG